MERRKLRAESRLRVIVPLALSALALVRCSDDDGDDQQGDAQTPGAGDASLDAGLVDASGSIDAHVATDASDASDTLDSGPDRAALIARGRYLVESVAVCGDCHTPRRADGSPDPARLLAGVDCFIDAVPADVQAGCLHARNLTNHETGLKNRSDQEIKDMMLTGVRPDGRALDPTMPYAVFGNMSEADADAIVAYLRTVPGVDHMTPPNQAPFNQTVQPVARFPEAQIPRPRADYVDRAAAERGRYLAGNVGICLECHTQRDAQGGLRAELVFQGGNPFPAAALGLPSAFPPIIYSSNITPHDNGIAGWSVDDVVRALKQGVDKDQESPICPPMPSGPMGAFAGLTDADARDIAHYLLSIPPGGNLVPEDCQIIPPPLPDAGADAGSTSDAGSTFDAAAG